MQLDYESDDNDEDDEPIEDKWPHLPTCESFDDQTEEALFKRLHEHLTREEVQDLQDVNELLCPEDSMMYTLSRHEFDEEEMDDEEYGGDEGEDEEEMDDTPNGPGELVLECRRARHFVEHFAETNAIDPYELSHLTCHTMRPSDSEDTRVDIVPGGLGDCTYEYIGTKVDFEADQKDFITDSDRERPLHRITHEETGAYVNVMIENYVYVTYFRHAITKESYPINLHDLGIKMLPFGIQHSKNKFTKITLKYVGGPSNYIFRSGAMVESGTYSPAIARKKHNNTMKILREYCGYKHIEVRDRIAQNIVAKGTLPFGVCLMLLRERYKSFVEYEDDNFAGAIIKIKRLDTFLANKTKVSSKKHKHKKHKSKHHHHHHHDDNTKTMAIDGTLVEDEEEDEEEGDDENEDSYEFYEAVDEDVFYNQGFDCYQPTEADRLSAAARGTSNNNNNNNSNTNASSSTTARQSDSHSVLNLHNPSELLEQRYLAPKKKEKKTVLVFAKGRIICAGCKSRNDILKSYGKVLEFLEACRDTPQNKAADAELRAQAKAEANGDNNSEAKKWGKNSSKKFNVELQWEFPAKDTEM